MDYRSPYRAAFKRFLSGAAIFVIGSAFGAWCVITLRYQDLTTTNHILLVQSDTILRMTEREQMHTDWIMNRETQLRMLVDKKKGERNVDSE